MNIEKYGTTNYMISTATYIPINKRRMRLLAHVVRMEEKPAKNSFNSRSMGGQWKQGHPRKCIADFEMYNWRDLG